MRVANPIVESLQTTPGASDIAWRLAQKSDPTIQRIIQATEAPEWDANYNIKTNM